jgi:hypothetical protein
MAGRDRRAKPRRHKHVSSSIRCAGYSVGR